MRLSDKARNNIRQVCLYLAIAPLVFIALACRVYSENEPSVMWSCATYFSAMIGLGYLWVIGFRQLSYGKSLASIGIIFACIGGFANLLAQLANGGHMPVHPDIFARITALPPCYISGGNLLFLGDIYFWGASIGDMIVGVGMVILLTGIVLELSKGIGVRYGNFKLKQQVVKQYGN